MNLAEAEFGIKMALREHGASEVVAFQQEDHPHLANTVLKTLEVQRQQLIEQLATVRAKDYAEYLGRFCQIDGLNIAISHIKEAAKKLG